MQPVGGAHDGQVLVYADAEFRKDVDQPVILAAFGNMNVEQHAMPVA
jgi:hypothetical protein